MSRDEIKKRRKKIEDEIERLEELIQFQEIKLKNLRKKCEHPKAERWNCAGDSGGSCPDCGWSY